MDIQHRLGASLLGNRESNEVPKASIFVVPPTAHTPLKSNHEHSIVPSSGSGPPALTLAAAAGIHPDGCSPDGNPTLLALPHF